MFKYIVLLIFPIYFLFAQEKQLPDSCYGKIIFSRQFPYSSKIILDVITYQNKCNVNWDYYAIKILEAEKNNLIQTINGFFDSTVIYEDNSLEDYFVSFEDLNFDGMNDLLIYEDRPPWGGNDYQIWLFDSLKNKFHYDTNLNSILRGGGEWEIDTANKTIKYSYDNGCSECWASDKYKFKKGAYTLIERTSSYDGLRLGYQKFMLIDGIFTLFPPYIARWGDPFSDFSFDTCITLKKYDVYFFPDDESKLKFSLEKYDTIECNSSKLIFTDFGEVLVTDELKLEEIESYPPNYNTFVSGDTLSIYFIEDGNYEFSHRGKYYRGKPFWSNEKILVIDTHKKITGKLLKEPEIVWWMRINDNKNRDGYIKLINDDFSSAIIQEQLKILKQ